MVVEHILRAYPETRDIFRAFQVRCEVYGGWTIKQLSESQDLDADAVVLALNQSLGNRSGTVPVPELLWDSACDGMMLIDADRRVLAINPTLERWIGRPGRTVVGRRECGALLACEGLHGERLWEHPDRCPGLRAIHRFKAVTAAEYTIRTGCGQRIPANASYTPIQLSAKGTVWALVVMRDIRLQKRHERTLLRQAARDPLTGLPNRTVFFTECGREINRAARHGRPIAVAMVDLDGFKTYNDAHGHLAGDGLLKALAEIMQTGIRSTELVARYGGDEFVLLLPETGASGAMALADRLRRMVAGFPFAGAQGKGHPTSPVPAEASCNARAATAVTLSIGVAVFPTDGRTAEALLAEADRRLFAAKRQGHNSVVGPIERGDPGAGDAASREMGNAGTTTDRAGSPSRAASISGRCGSEPE